MKKFILYSKNIRNIIRVISLLAFVILVLRIINRFFFPENFSDTLFETFIINISNILICILCIILFFFPTKLEIISFSAFLYSYSDVLIDPINPMGILLFTLGLVVFILRNLNNKKLKYINFFLIFLYLVFFVFGLFLNKDIVFTTIVEKLAYFFVLSLIIFFSYQILILIIESSTETLKILDLSNYPTLTKRDAEILILIQQKKKYKEIASILNLSEGTVRNRMYQVFSILQVGDKTGFLNSYSDYQIIFSIPTDNPTKAKGEK